MVIVKLENLMLQTAPLGPAAVAEVDSGAVRKENETYLRFRRRGEERVETDLLGLGGGARILLELLLVLLGKLEVVGHLQKKSNF